jgi:uncharacterized protein YkwD
MSQTHRMNWMLLVSLLAGSFCASAQAEDKTSDANYLHGHPTLVRMWEHSNQIRHRYNLPAQSLSPELTKAAQDHAWFMAKTGQFSHQ